MYRKNRKAITDRCRKIVAENNVRTQGQFAELYEQEYGEKVSQTSVHRMFANANISIDESTGFYSYQSKSDSVNFTGDTLQDFLSTHSYGRYTHEKGVPSIWLSVDFHTESLATSLIYDFCNGEVSIMRGFGCLWIKCHTHDTYEKLKAVISKYKIQ